MVQRRFISLLPAFLLVCSGCGGSSTGDQPKPPPAPAPAVETGPQHADAGDRASRLLTRSTLLLADNKPEEALAELDKLDAMRPGSVEAAVNRAVILREAGEAKRALDSLPASDDLRVRLLRMELSFSTGQAAQGLEVLKSLAEAHPERAGIAYRYGQRLLFANDAAAAVQQLERAVAAMPDNKQAAAALAEALLMAGRHQDALEHLRSLAADIPGANDALSTASQALKSGDSAAAEPQLRIAVNLVNADAATLRDRDLLTGQAAQGMLERLDGEESGFAPKPVEFVEAGTIPLSGAAGPVGVASNTTLLLPALGKRIPLSNGAPGTPVELSVGAIDGSSRVSASVANVLKDDRRIWFLGARFAEERGGDLLPIPIRTQGLENLRDHRLRDVDLDGDPDLIGIQGGAGKNRLRLFAGSGDGGFQKGKDLSDFPVDAWAFVDADRDGNPDLTVRSGSTVTLLHNRGHLDFVALRAAGKYPGACLAAVDLDADNLPEPVLTGASVSVPGLEPSAGAFTLAGGAIQAAELAVTWADAPPSSFDACAGEDVDGDGREDILVLADGRARVLRRTDSGFAEAWTSAPGVLAVALLDADHDGDGDLALLRSDGLTLMRNRAGDAAGWVTVSFGISKDSRDGYGTRATLRAGGHSGFDRVEAPGGLIQRAAHSIRLPLGGRAFLDRIVVTWPNRVWQQVDSGDRGDILHIQQEAGLLGSCPFLYAWNGREFVFVNDLLGNAPLGLPMGPGRFLPAAPVEYMRIDPGLLSPQDGRYLLRFTDELREVTFLDQAALTAVDHPEGTRVFSSDGVRPPPFPDSLVYVTADHRPPDRALDASGADLRDKLLRVDRSFAGAVAPGPFPGTAEPHRVDLTWNELPGDDLALVVNGSWYWGEASSYAGPQALEWTSSPPRLLRIRDGAAEPLDVMLPIPGGRPKWVVADLGDRLEPGDTLRIESNWQIYWDSIALARIVERRPMAEAVHLAPSSAELRFRGYSSPIELGDGPPHPFDYEDVAVSRPWPRMPGWYTAWGDVRSLIEDADDTSISVGHGEEVALEFAVPDAPPEGTTRTWFFKSVGWDKDGDPKTAWGEALEPWPSLVSPVYPPPIPPDRHPSRTRWVSRR